MLNIETKYAIVLFIYEIKYSRRNETSSESTVSTLCLIYSFNLQTETSKFKLIVSRHIHASQNKKIIISLCSLYDSDCDYEMKL